MKVRIIPGDFGRYLSGGGSWDDSKPDPASFEVELVALPAKGCAILYRSKGVSDGELRVGNVQEVLVSKTCIYVFVPFFTKVV